MQCFVILLFDQGVPNETKGMTNLNTHGTLLVYLLCRLLTASCFKKNRFGEIVNSGFQSNSKVQSTLSQNKLFEGNIFLLMTLTYFSWFTEQLDFFSQLFLHRVK